jgi:hypothetical protein
MRWSIRCSTLVAILVAAKSSAAGNLPDTAHCNPRIIVREARSKRPLDVRVSLQLVPQTGEVPPGSERDGSTYDSGTAEFPALPPGVYQVHVRGVCGERPAPHWKPPNSPRRNEVPVGEDPWKRPTEVQRFDSHLTWQVEWGNCRDSLVVLAKGTGWRIRTREKIIDTSR